MSKTRLFGLENLFQDDSPLAEWKERTSKPRKSIDNFLRETGNTYSRFDSPKYDDFDRMINLGGEKALQIIYKHYPRFKNIISSLNPKDLETRARRNEFIYNMAIELREFVDFTTANPRILGVDGWGIADSKLPVYNPNGITPEEQNRLSHEEKERIFLLKLQNGIKESPKVINKRIKSIENYNIKDAWLWVGKYLDEFSNYVSDRDVIHDFTKTNTQVRALKDFENGVTYRTMKLIVEDMPKYINLKKKADEQRENQGNQEKTNSRILRARPKVKGTKEDWTKSYENQETQKPTNYVKTLEKRRNQVIELRNTFRDEIKNLQKIGINKIYIPKEAYNIEKQVSKFITYSDPQSGLYKQRKDSSALWGESPHTKRIQRE